MNKSLLAFLCLIFLFSCEKTDQPKESWVLKVKNQTSYQVKLEFISINQPTRNLIFMIDSDQNEPLFYGASGLFADNLSSMFFDSCIVLFENTSKLNFARNDTFQHNILKVENFEKTGEYDGEDMVKLYTITNKDVMMADTL